MKKFLLSMAVVAMGANVMLAEDPIASIVFENGSTAYEKVSSYSKEWKSTDGMWIFNGFNNNNNGWAYIVAGSKNADSSASIASGVAIPVKVGSIVISIGDKLNSSAISSATLYVADDAEFKNAVTTPLTVPTKKNSDWVINIETPTPNKFYKIELVIPKQSSNGQAFSITKIALYQNQVSVEEPTPTEYPAVKSVKETIATAPDTKVTVDYTLTVGFKNGSNVFACDAAGDFIQIYGANSYEENDIVPAGWDATYKLYNSVTPELVPEGTLPASASKGNFEPKTVAAADVTTALVNNVIKIKDVVFSEATPATKTNFTGKVGETELSFRNNYTIDAVVAGTYDVTVVVTIYEDAPSLYVIKYEGEGAETPVDPTPTEVVSVKSVKEAIATASNTKVKVDFPLTVAFKYNSNVFAVDANGDFIQVYGSNKYEIYDVIPAGWEATYELYNNNTPEFKPAGTLPDATGKGEFTPAAVAAASISNDLVNSVVLIKNVVFTDDTPSEKVNFTGKVGDTELSFRNNYTIDGVAAGTYDVTVVVTIYNNAPSLYVINYAESGDSSVDEIGADDNAEAVYFNLQGVKVANPENGLYIKVQGKKATKVIIK